jgi:hypothetical protein
MSEKLNCENKDTMGEESPVVPNRLHIISQGEQLPKLSIISDTEEGFQGRQLYDLSKQNGAPSPDNDNGGYEQKNGREIQFATEIHISDGTSKPMKHGKVPSKEKRETDKIEKDQVIGFFQLVCTLLFITYVLNNICSYKITLYSQYAIDHITCMPGQCISVLRK